MSLDGSAPDASTASGPDPPSVSPLHVRDETDIGLRFTWHDMDESKCNIELSQADMRALSDNSELYTGKERPVVIQFETKCSKRHMELLNDLLTLFAEKTDSEHKSAELFRLCERTSIKSLLFVTSALHRMSAYSIAEKIGHVIVIRMTAADGDPVRLFGKGDLLPAEQIETNKQTDFYRAVELLNRQQ